MQLRFLGALPAINLSSELLKPGCDYRKLFPFYDRAYEQRVISIEEIVADAGAGSDRGAHNVCHLIRQEITWDLRFEIVQIIVRTSLLCHCRWREAKMIASLPKNRLGNQTSQNIGETERHKRRKVKKREDIPKKKRIL